MQPVSLPPYPAGYTWRPIERGDVAGLVQLHAVCREADHRETALTADSFNRILDQLGDEITTNSLAGFTAEGELIAYASFFCPPTPNEFVANCNGLVHLHHRQKGLGTFLLQWEETAVRQKFADEPADKPRVLSSGCLEEQKDVQALLTATGFQPVRYFFKMERDFSQPLPERTLPKGLRLSNWTPELDASTMDTMNDSFKNHWGFFTIDPEAWKRWFTGKSTFRADLTYLAVDGDTVVGCCLTAVNPENNAQTGIQEAWLEDIGVRYAWQKKGIATALIAAALRACQSAGIEKVSLGVDSENVTNALGLYESLGFKAVRREINLRKTLQ